MENSLKRFITKKKTSEILEELGVSCLKGEGAIETSAEEIHILTHFSPSHITLTTLSLQFSNVFCLFKQNYIFRCLFTLSLHFYSKHGINHKWDCIVLGIT